MRLPIIVAVLATLFAAPAWAAPATSCHRVAHGQPMLVCLLDQAEGDADHQFGQGPASAGPSDAHNSMFALVVSSGLPYRDVARIAGTSEANVKVRVHRARVKL